MALAFDKNNIQIKFFSNENLDSDIKKELIIYPLVAYKIIAPVIDDLTLNIFQKYILSILNKGNFTLDQISEWLNLDILLVKTIAVELSNKNLIDLNTMSITSKGKEIISESFSWFKNADNLKKDIRYIFQDIFTQELYPVVLDFNYFEEAVNLKNGKLTIKTKGKENSFPYKIIEPKHINLSAIRKPEIKEILKTLKKHADQYIPNSINDLKKIPNAVNYLEEEPDLLYCAFWVSSEKNNTLEEDIKCSDPFNIYDETYWLRNNILKAQEQNNTLKNVLHNLVKIEKEEKIKASEFMTNFDKELDKDLSKTFDFSLKNEFPKLNEAIKEYYFDIKFYEIREDVSHLKNAFRKSQIVLETLLKIIYEKYKDDYEDVISNQTYDGGKFHAYKNEVITKIKTINNESTIPNWYHDEFNGVYNALKNPDKASLRALFIAGVLASYYNNENTIFSLLKEKNNLPICIEEIAENRNKVGHKYLDIPDNEINQYYNDVKKMQKDIEEILQIFLDKH